MSDLVRDQRPRIELPGDNRLLSDFAAELASEVSGADIFTRGGLVYVLNEACDGLKIISPEAFMTWCEQFVVGFRVKRSSDSGQSVTLRRTMTRSVAEGVLASPQFLSKLRVVERFNPIPLPHLNGRLRILPRGYDVETKTFTQRKSIGYADGMPLAQSRQIIDELLSEFGFADSGRSKSVAVASMLTVFGKQLLPTGALRPCFIYLANSEGAGKTLLVKCATVPVLGYAPSSTCPSDEEEMRKILLSAVVEMRPVLLLDNVKGHLSSESLEGFLTAQQWSGRILGGNKTFTGDNGTLVFVTGNGCTVSPDMRRRSLFVELFMQEQHAEDRVFATALETDEILNQRENILTGLMGFVRYWAVEHACVESPHSHSSFTHWAKIIGGIVEAAGYGSPVARANIQGAGDTDGNDMEELVKAIASGASFRAVTFEELLDIAKERGLFESITAGLDSDSTRMKSRVRLAKTLGRYDRRLISTYRFSLDGKGHSRRYQVQSIGTHGRTVDMVFPSEVLK